MLLSVDPGAAVSLADQIAAQVRGQIADGSLRPGERLPAARHVAEGLDVNMHTVLRAYAQLRDDGLIELRRGRGAVVRDDVSAVRVEVLQRVDDLLQAAARVGMSRPDIIDLIRKAPS
jgi:DNA-binding transcriptional regulator YhcF (GntR family)